MNNIKYSFLIPYYKRSDLFKNTIASFIHFEYYQKQNIELVIIEDYKNFKDEDEHKKLIDIIDVCKKFFLVNHIIRPEEYIYNPCKAFNNGARESKGEYLVITNPECAHTKNIIPEIDSMIENQKDSFYIVCGCYDPTLWWLQHSIYHNRTLHFCTIINKQDFFRIGGFDEGYADGIAYEDNDFVLTIKKNVLKIINRDDLVVLHQPHDRIYKDINPELEKKNLDYYMKKWNN